MNESLLKTTITRTNIKNIYNKERTKQHYSNYKKHRTSS